VQRGEEFAGRRNELGLQNAVQEFRNAIALEPEYTEAWAGLADAYSAMANFNFMEPKTALSEAKQCALRAVSIDPNSGLALGVLGYVISIDLRDWRSAEPYFIRAIRANPKLGSIRLWYGAFLGKMGRSSEAIKQIRAGLDQEPSSLVLNQQLGVELFRARRFRDYYNQARELVRLQPFESSSHLSLARALEWQGRFDEALQSCDEAKKYDDSETALCFRGIIEAHRGNRTAAQEIAIQIFDYWNRKPLETIQVAILYCLLGQHSMAVQLLNEGFDREDSTVLTAPTNPYFDALRDDPGYRQFLDRIG
jgi:tetratricopeptide (TPR) repeat protein